VEAAQTRYDNAKNAVDDAQRSLDKLKTDHERAKSQSSFYLAKAVESAKETVQLAQLSLEEAKTDRDRARIQHDESASEKLESARQSVADAELALSKAQTSLARAKKDYEKQLEEAKSSLALKKLNAEMNKSSNSSVSAAEFALEEAKLELEKAEQNLGKAKIYAPMSGQILAASASKGEKVQASQNTGALIFGTGSNSGFITLCDVTKIYLTASIPEGDIVGMAAGQKIQVVIDALGNETFSGTVTNVSSLPGASSTGITTYNVTCKLDKTSSEIKDGMNAYITFVKKESKDVLLIPANSVFVEDELQYVNALKADGSYEKRKVVCGLSNGEQTEVISGLSEGEVVAVGR
jgi:HlyD family secretion protein